MATLLFRYVNDCWGVQLDAGTILSCNMVAHMDSVVLIALLKKVNKQVEGKIKHFKLNEGSGIKCPPIYL